MTTSVGGLIVMKRKTTKRPRRRPRIKKKLLKRTEKRKYQKGQRSTIQWMPPRMTQKVRFSPQFIFIL